MRKSGSARRGGAIVEFALVIMLLLSVTFAGIEFDRVFLVYTSVANASKVGVRYAIVHGGTRTGVGEPASGATAPGKVEEVVKNWAKIGFLDAGRLDVKVEYPGSVGPSDPGNSPGSSVVVTVSYPYDPLTFIPLSMNLSSTSRGVIVF